MPALLFNLALGVLLVLFGRRGGWRGAVGIMLLLMSGIIGLKKEWM